MNGTVIPLKDRTDDDVRAERQGILDKLRTTKQPFSFDGGIGLGAHEFDTDSYNESVRLYQVYIDTRENLLLQLARCNERLGLPIANMDPNPNRALT